MLDWDLLNEIYSREFELYLDNVKNDKFIRDGKNIELDDYVKETAKYDDESLIFVQHFKPDCEKIYKKKIYWEFFAKVLIERRETSEEILIYMFYWLKDLNLPGSLLVFEYLSQIDKDNFFRAFENACKIAIDDKNEAWLLNMCRIINYSDFSLNDLKDKAMAKLLYEISKNA